jgi:hypothetical protein
LKIKIDFGEGLTSFDSNYIINFLNIDYRKTSKHYKITSLLKYTRVPIELSKIMNNHMFNKIAIVAVNVTMKKYKNVKDVTVTSIIGNNTCKGEKRLNVGVSNFDFSVVHEVEKVDDVVEGHVPQDDDRIRRRIGAQQAPEEQGTG